MGFDKPPSAGEGASSGHVAAGRPLQGGPAMTEASAITGAMTVDVEDYFQVAAFASTIRREDWGAFPCRIEQNLDRILALFAEYGTSATFFTLGWIAERYPSAMQRIVSAGHELASHGYEHKKVHAQDRDSFRLDIRRTKQILEDVGGQRIMGYRAASFSIDERSVWAFDVLAEEGYEYSSSIYPVRHDHYGMPSAPRFAHRPSEKHRFLEIPISTAILFNRNMPSGGGGYFRLLPYGLSRWMLRRIAEKDRKPIVFYFHPWEIDRDQPRISGVPLRSRFRHYVNLSAMERRLRGVLTDFRWNRMDRVFL